MSEDQSNYESTLAAAYQDIVNKYKRRETASQILSSPKIETTTNENEPSVLIQTFPLQDADLNGKIESVSALLAAGAPAAKEESRNSILANNDADKIISNNEVHNEIVLLKGIVMELRSNYEKAVAEIVRLKAEAEKKLEENQEYIKMRDGLIASYKRIEELEQLLITEKLNKMVAQSENKVNEMKNAEKKNDVIVVNETPIQVNSGAARRNSEIDMELKAKQDLLDSKTMQNALLEKELNLIKAELQMQKDLNNKLQDGIEVSPTRKSINKEPVEFRDPTFPEKLIEKLNQLEKVYEEEKSRAAELAVLLEAERQHVKDLNDKVESINSFNKGESNSKKINDLENQIKNLNDDKQKLQNENNKLFNDRCNLEKQIADLKNQIRELEVKAQQINKPSPQPVIHNPVPVVPQPNNNNNNVVYYPTKKEEPKPYIPSQNNVVVPAPNREIYYPSKQDYKPHTPGYVPPPNVIAHNNGYLPDKNIVNKPNNIPVKHVDPQVKYVDPQVKYVDNHVKYVDNHVKYVDPQVKYVDNHVKYVVDPQVKYVDNHVKYVDPQVKYVNNSQVKYVDNHVKYVDPQVKYVNDSNVKVYHNENRVPANYVDNNVKYIVNPTPDTKSLSKSTYYVPGRDTYKYPQADNHVVNYKPADYKPAEYKPADYKPAEYKPAEYKPSDYKPADYKPNNYVNYYSKDSAPANKVVEIKDVKNNYYSNDYRPTMGGSLVQQATEIKKDIVLPPNVANVVVGNYSGKPEDITKRIAKETDDIVSRVLKESNINLKHTSSVNYVNTAPNYLSSDKKLDTSLVKNKSVLQNLNSSFKEDDLNRSIRNSLLNRSMSSYIEGKSKLN